MGKVKNPINVSDAIPHGPEFSLLRNVIGHNADETVCDVHISHQSLFQKGGNVPAYIGIEYMAQAVAAHAGLEARRNGHPPKLGFLLGTRQMKIYSNGFAFGKTLHVIVRREWGDADLFSFHCSIIDSANSNLLAEARLTVIQPDDPDNILQEEPS